MKARQPKIARAWLESAQRGCIELLHDWRSGRRPPLSLGAGAPPWATFVKVADHVSGRERGYFVDKKGQIHFVAEREALDEERVRAVGLFLAGDFNGWAGAGGDEWRLQPGTLAGEEVWTWSGDAQRFFADPPMRFKFVTGDHHWLPVPDHAPNIVRDADGNVNRAIDPDRTGQHLFQFTLLAPLDLSRSWTVHWHGDDAPPVPLMPGDFFHRLKSDAPMGATVTRDRTVFRLFAPRARRVTLCLCEKLAQQADAYRYDLVRRGDGAWELALDRDLHGWFYWYHLDGARDAFTHFDPAQRVLDPWALACVGREGPGIVLDRARIARPHDRFKTPAWQDLVIMEAHVRDLVQHAPVRISPAERMGFSGLRRWVESPDFYLHRLGVNCVELQPVQEADNPAREDYHWGYMTVNWFAPASSYALDPENASQVRELQELVAAFHARGIAVLLDVVYNHAGEPAHLLFIDKLYYFEVDPAGHLMNWSGCGNDLRAHAAMAKRLIIESCLHLIETYGVDGFRFDLAELLGVDVLRDIETAVKQAKPDAILIAEPWSFRGHIAGALASTGWASWNDGYRNFLRDFVRGGGTHEAYEYFLKGSPWYFAHWPAQTVNYTESHDDRTWIDVITEQGDGNGHHPTAADRRRTHLMVATLMMSVGIPMLSAGQDFLRSKQGVNNTYLRGDLNALDYRRILRFPGTHAYFAAWIAFRRSAGAGALLRLYSRPTEDYFHFHFAEGAMAAATLYNADHSRGPCQLLFAINPTFHDLTIPIGELAETGGAWRQLADHECFYGAGNNQVATHAPHANHHAASARGGPQRVEPELFIPGLGCALWVRGD